MKKNVFLRVQAKQKNQHITDFFCPMIFVWWFFTSKSVYRCWEVLLCMWKQLFKSFCGLKSCHVSHPQLGLKTTSLIMKTIWDQIPLTCVSGYILCVRFWYFPISLILKCMLLCLGLVDNSHICITLPKTARQPSNMVLVLLVLLNKAGKMDVKR